MLGMSKLPTAFERYLWGDKPMPYSREWAKRVRWWMAELLNHFYTPLGRVELVGFTTTEYLSYHEAIRGEFSPMPPGTRWGAKWEYGWFRGSIELPEEAEGRRVVFLPNQGGEGLVFVNGHPAGARDHAHTAITLSRRGVPGTNYEILIESYAGHGPRLENIGPTPPGRVAVPEPPAAQVEVGESTFGIWEEEAYQLFLDVSTLYKVLISISDRSLRAQEIAKGLRDFTLIVDFEQPYRERVESFRRARERLKPLLDCVNGSTAPLMYIFGQSHLDLAWLWPKVETARKSARTLATQLALLDEYPDYRFFMCQPPLFAMLKENYPQLYARLMDKVQSGQIMVEGGMWVEADTNMPSGESLIRQLMYGRRFYKEEFGVESRLVWLPDCFGFSAALPQIMAGCGIKYFATQKLLRFYNDGDPFPYNIFMWEGIDGTQILTHVFKRNNSHIDPEMLIQRWEEDRNQEEDIAVFLFPFGFGDGGGGPARYHVEYARRLQDLEGAPRTQMSHPVQFFQDVESQGRPKFTYVGELYFPAHRGTYTTQAKTKKGNRQSEFALREAEFWLAAADSLAGAGYPYGELERLWKMVLFNQFHDVLPGTSIARVHAEAEQDYAGVLAEAEALTRKAFRGMVPAGEGITVFNSLSWQRTELVPLPDGIAGVRTPAGEVLPVQDIGGTRCAEVTIPPCGWITLLPAEARTASRQQAVADRCSLENEHLRVQFNSRGQITSIYDKDAGLELAGGLCNDFRMYKDVTTAYDAWDIDSMYESVPVPLESEASVEVLYSGGLIAGLRIERMLHNSRLVQDVTLRRGSRRLDFKTTIDWREDHKLLKVSFPVQITADEALHEIQFGYVKRSTHKSRQYDADRFEVCAHKWTALAETSRGCAVLNDCKYGVSTAGGRINLTLLKAPLVPDMHADRGLQEFTYAFYAWNGSFAESGLTQAAYELNSPVMTAQGAAAAGERSLFSLDHSAVVLSAVKLAEDQSGDIILRLYESTKTTASCLLNTSLAVKEVWETNMLEEPQQKLGCVNGTVSLVFRPFEVKTLRLRC